MATAAVKNRCAICNKEKASCRCEGCSRTFCYTHFTDHRQELSKQLDEIAVSRDVFRQTLDEQTNQPRKHPLILQIDTWELESINKIRKSAEDARQQLLKYTTEHVAQIETKLAKLTDQLREHRQGNDFVETDLDQWNEELTRLTNELAKPQNVSLHQDTTSLVTKLLVRIPTSLRFTTIRTNARWMQNGVTVAGGNGQGSGLNQISNPCGVYVGDDDQAIYVADYGNHRVVEWKSGATSGQVIAGGNGAGNQTNQLNAPSAVIVDTESDSLITSDYSNQRVVRWPRRNGTTGETIISGVTSWGLGMDSDGYLYVSDYGKHEVKRWKMGETNGTVVAGGNEQGSRADQLNSPMGIFVDQDRSLYVTDRGNHRVMKWMKGAREGIVVAGGQGAGSGVTQLSSPWGTVVDQLGTVYVADDSNHRVMRWTKGVAQGSVVVGGNGQGAQPNQFNRCLCLSFDGQGNLYVSDHNNHRVQKFIIEPNSTQ